jgi:hypothetical protein
MTISAFRRFVFGYGGGFALLYIVVRVRGLALFTVYPAQGVVLLGMHRSRDVGDPVLDFLAPEMFWYGWTASAAIGALVLGLIAALLPARLGSFWAVCVVVAPLMAAIACFYLTIPWFRL